MRKPGCIAIEIMAIGAELLTPHYQDTNSLHLTEKLNDLGFEVTYKTIVGDDRESLGQSIRNAMERSDLIIGIGGLGPTQDDRTREAFASALGRELILREDLVEKIRERFALRGMVMPDVNTKQAYIIQGSEPLENRHGTAPGLWLETETHRIVLLPGPPQELKPMFEASVLPRLAKLRTGFTGRRILKTAGLTESKIESLIHDLHPKTSSLRLTTLAYPGQIEIHLAGYSDKSQEEAEERVRLLEQKILERLGDHVFTTAGERLEEVIGKLLRIHKKTLAVAESCTGGFLGHRITNVSGSSEYFLEGIVVYNNQAKIELLGVPRGLIEKHGAVSLEAARAMAAGIRKRAQADFSLAVTGIAGPTGGSAEKPIGLVYVALAQGRGVVASENRFLGNREAVKFQSSQKALDMLRRALLELRQD